VREEYPDPDRTQDLAYIHSTLSLQCGHGSGTHTPGPSVIAIHLTITTSSPVHLALDPEVQPIAFTVQDLLRDCDMPDLPLHFMVFHVLLKWQQTPASDSASGIPGAIIF